MSKPSVGRTPSSAKKASVPMRKREHETSGESPEKKREREASEASEDASNQIFMVGFTPAEVRKYEGLLPGDWTIVETISESVTHMVIKTMSTLKNTQQILPIYYCVLKGAWILKSSFLPSAASKKKNWDGPTPLQNEQQHEYDGMEAESAAHPKAGFPSILDLIRTRDSVRDLKERRRPRILESEPFSKVAIVSGRSKESKQRREELKLMMEAAGCTVADESVLKTWKAQRKRKGVEVEKPSIVIIVNGETNVKGLGLDDEAMRDLLKGRCPIFYEEYITNIFLYTMSTEIDDLLLHSFVFIHDQFGSVDPDGKLQERVLDGVGDSDNEMRSQPTTPSIRRANSRATSSARESTSGEQIDKKTKKRGKREEEEEVVAPPTKGRGRAKKDEMKDEQKEGEEEKKEGGTPKAPKKEVKKRRGGKEEKKEEKEEPKEEKMEVDDGVDPALADGNADALLAEFEAEIEARNERGGGREERSEREMRELREMMEDRGDEDGEQPLTPEPILFSQQISEPGIVIPEVLRKALETKVDEGEGKDAASRDGLIIDEKASDDGSDTIVAGGTDDIADMEALREEMNNERTGGVKMEEDEWDYDMKSETPQGFDVDSDVINKTMSEVMSQDETKEWETCNHLGSQHIYIDEQPVAELHAHFSAPRLEWFDLIIDVREKMPWIKSKTALRPACDLNATPMGRHVTDLFYTFYHQGLDDDTSKSSVLTEVNASNAMGMYEAEWEEHKGRRPHIDLLIKMLHEFAVKRHSEDLNVPERACAALREALSAFLPSSVQAKHYWLTVLSGGSEGIKGRAGQVMVEMAKRTKTFFIKALLATECFLPCVAQFVTYFCEVDLLCCQTPVVEYEFPKTEKEQSQESSQKTTRARKSRKKKNPLEKFPLILLLIMELDEEPRRGLSESAILVVQKLMEHALLMKRHQEWTQSETLQRALMCLLEAARWHCSQAATSALTGAERRRMKAAASQASQDQSSQQGPNVPVELKDNVKRVVKLLVKKGYPMQWIRDAMCVSWLEDIVNS